MNTNVKYTQYTYSLLYFGNMLDEIDNVFLTFKCKNNWMELSLRPEEIRIAFWKYEFL